MAAEISPTENTEHTNTRNTENNVFADELRHWRDLRGLSRTALAKQMGYDRSYVSKIESGNEHPSSEFAAHAEAALRAGGALKWKFGNRAEPASDKQPRPSEAMRSAGIVQDDDARLRISAQQFVLPDEADDARRVFTELSSAIERVARLHTFGKGMGLAAPQIGIDRAAAIVRPPSDGAPVTLLNPRIVDASTETDEQYEGCLSFFDVRGMVPRPLTIHVEHHSIDGQPRITVFERAMARLVAHEVDHLHGILYTDHMPGDHQTIPIEQYRGTGTTWQY